MQAQQDLHDLAVHHGMKGVLHAATAKQLRCRASFVQWCSGTIDLPNVCHFGSYASQVAEDSLLPSFLRSRIVIGGSCQLLSFRPPVQGHIQ